MDGDLYCMCEQRIRICAYSLAHYLPEIKNLGTSGRYIHEIDGGVLLHVRATKAQDAQPR